MIYDNGAVVTCQTTLEIHNHHL